MKESLRTLVVIPTFNERDNIVNTLDAIYAVRSETHVLVVDDSSPDGTGSCVRSHPRYGDDLMLLSRSQRTGLADAYRDAMGWALRNQYDRIVQMDGDGSHRAADLPTLLSTCRTDDSLVVGSRWLPSGRVDNWPLVRQLVSKGGNLFARVVLNCDIRDMTSGFRVWGSRALREALANERGVMEGYGFQVEMAYVHWRRGGDVIGVPIHFVGREMGSSKMTIHIAVEAALGTMRLRRELPKVKSSRESC